MARKIVQWIWPETVHCVERGYDIFSKNSDGPQRICDVRGKAPCKTLSWLCVHDALFSAICWQGVATRARALAPEDRRALGKTCREVLQQRGGRPLPWTACFAGNALDQLCPAPFLDCVALLLRELMSIGEHVLHTRTIQRETNLLIHLLLAPFTQCDEPLYNISCMKYLLSANKGNRRKELS